MNELARVISPPRSLPSLISRLIVIGWSGGVDLFHAGNGWWFPLICLPASALLLRRMWMNQIVELIQCKLVSPH